MKKLLISILILNSAPLQAQESITLSRTPEAESLLIIPTATVSGATLNGTITIGLTTPTANRVFASPDGATGAPTFRPLVINDVLFAVNTTENQTIGGLKTFNNGIGLSVSQIILYNGNSFIRTGGGMDQSFFAGQNAGDAPAGGNGNVGIGFNVLTLLDNTATGNHNTAIGWNSMQTATTARRNTFVGSRSGELLTTSTGSDENTGVGWDVMMNATDAAFNAAFGSEAGLALTTGDNNTFLGRLAGSSVTTGSFNIFIGDNVFGAAASASQINIGNAWYGDRIGQTLGIGVSTPLALLHIKAGSASANSAPIKLTSGALMTTAEAGAIEYLTNTFYTSTTTGRGVTPTESFTINSSATSMTSGTSAQSVFNASRDVFTVGAGTTYYFEAQYTITGMGGSSKDIKTLFTSGGGASFTISYTAISWGGTTSVLSSTQQSINVTTASTTTVLPTNTFAEAIIQLKGFMRVTESGTVTPQIQFSAAPGGSIQGAINSYFKIYPLGDDYVASVGKWN
jgi:hypothetical protein